MTESDIAQRPMPGPWRTPAGWLGGLGLAVGAGVLWWFSLNDPAALPFLAPWDFAPLMVLTTVLALWWYASGIAQTAPARRPARWRRIAFVTGVALCYFVLQTRFEYMAQHMFFLNWAQHIVMHHLGPMLIALGWPWQ